MGDKSVETLDSKIRFLSVLVIFLPLPKQCWFFYYIDRTNQSAYTTLNWGAGGISELTLDANKIEQVLKYRKASFSKSVSTTFVAHCSSFALRLRILNCALCRSESNPFASMNTLETSIFESLNGGQFTLSTQLIKPNYLVILRSPPTQHHSFDRNSPPLCVSPWLVVSDSTDEGHSPETSGHLLRFWYFLQHNFYFYCCYKRHHKGLTCMWGQLVSYIFTAEPPFTTTYRKRPPLLSDQFTKIPSFQVKLSFLEPLVSDHLSLTSWVVSHWTFDGIFFSYTINAWK